MNSRTKRVRKICALAAIALGVAASAFLLSFSAREETDADAKHGRAVREVRLLSRSIVIPADADGSAQKAAFSPVPPKASRRGTAAFILVSKERVTAEVRNRASACGARVSGVVPPYGLVVEADAQALAKLREDGSFVAAEALLAEDKMPLSLKRVLASAESTDVSVKIIPLIPDDTEEISNAVEAMGWNVADSTKTGRGFVRATVPADRVRELAERGDVRWIERDLRPKLFNNVAVRPGLMNATPVRDVRGLTGKGQIVSITDSGLDTGNPDTVKADFAGRIEALKTAAGCVTFDKDGHGTHVAGSIAGNGALSDGEFRGVAPEARLSVLQCMENTGYLILPYEFADFFRPDKNKSDSYIHSASWGDEADSEYDSNCAAVDEWLWENTERLAVFAAGNVMSGQTYMKMSTPAGAKNVLAVGATETLRSGKGANADNPSEVAYFSARGPMVDGRIKPDICAPGTYILSTRSTMSTKTMWGVYDSNTNYLFSSGTSMATPMVSGSAAIVRQWLEERRGYTNAMPTAALMKAVLMGGAHDMGGDANAKCGGAAPNSVQGWGRVDLGETLYPSNAAVRIADRIQVPDGDVYRMVLSTTNAAPLAVQLVWTDYPGELGAAQALVNDLDLVVSNETSGATWYGNGIRGGDRTNTVESIRIPIAEAGTYSVLVRGHSVPYGPFDGGATALYVRGAFEDYSEEPETVELVVEVEEGDVAGATTPEPGTHRIEKGTIIQLSAEAYPVNIKEFLKEDNSVVRETVMRRDVAGWTGEGDVPQTGEGKRIAVAVTRDSRIKWRWSAKTNVLLRSYAMLSSYNQPDRFVGLEESWPEFNETIRFTVPESLPYGSEDIDITGEGLRYLDANGALRTMTVQRLGRIERAITNGKDTYPLTDSSGHMPREFTLTINEGTDILYCYYDIDSVDPVTTLPEWWRQRYVALNPDADAVRFTAVSPEYLEWTGGAGLNRILERTTVLGPEADWRQVATIPPQPVLTNRWNVPSAYSTNSFYRIRTGAK